ncbi:expressed unknown protein [Seminavis robusta]|uniref:O-fucosyltransferase family protein n=1 Tax=Seminavis robusta TaxID=568900 RepID=A0A9N8DZH8_9STRA|nr:expressed unknown protein [Seminavis robusta]|eukprot:Sro502_g155500.1 n/a (2137) ;mRNA; r:5526-12324
MMKFGRIRILALVIAFILVSIQLLGFSRFSISLTTLGSTGIGNTNEEAPVLLSQDDSPPPPQVNKANNKQEDSDSSPEAKARTTQISQSQRRTEVQQSGTTPSADHVQPKSPRKTPLKQPDEPKEQDKRVTEAPAESVSSSPKKATKEAKAVTEANKPNFMTCTATESNPQQQHQHCCAAWSDATDSSIRDQEIDDWWLHRPDWESPMALQNDTHFCFQIIANHTKRHFLNQLHQLQWDNGGSCSQIMKSIELNSGYGASTDWIVQSMFHATQQQQPHRPFQIATNKRVWIYSTNDTQHWGYCPETDSRCYYLPISPCNRNESILGEHYPARSGQDPIHKLHYQWIREYIYRPKHVFRTQQWKLRQSQALDTRLTQPCSVLHVRRTDVGNLRPPFRRYAAVQEYLDQLDDDNDAVPMGSPIFLLTDDQSTIDEIHTYHSNTSNNEQKYQWVYLDRPRYTGLEGGFNGHLPSGDPPSELVAIETELALALSRCTHAVIGGRSAFTKNLVERLDLEGTPYQKFFLNTGVDKEETMEKWARKKTHRVNAMFHDIDTYYAQRGIAPKYGTLISQQQQKKKKRKNKMQKAMVVDDITTTQFTPGEDDRPIPSPQELEAANQLVTCNQEQCCGTWEVDADPWWIHHPTWEISLENQTHFCFAPIPNAKWREFLQQVHDRQWHSSNCSGVEKTVEVNSGFGSSIAWMVNSFWHAHKNKVPFQIIHGNRQWLYAAKDNSSWAYCQSEDTRCYYLPVSRCSRRETIRGEHHDARPRDKHEKELHYLLKKYLTRPNQKFRQKIYEMRQSIHMKYPCTTIHVRRSDAGVPTTPFRRYAAVQEYVDAGSLKEGDNVFLMTDDESTIDEIKKHLPNNYNWMYFERQRNRGVANGFDGHIPSQDHGLEMVAIASELQLASTCEKMVFGVSGFMASLMDDLDISGKSYTKHFVDTEVSKQEARKWKADTEGRIVKFLDDIEEVYRNKTLAMQQGDASNPSREARTGSLKGLSVDDANRAVKCQNTSSSVECCASWDVDVDQWWLHRPDWEVSREDKESFCFSPIRDQIRAQFMRDLHERQWVTGKCSEVQRSDMVHSGWGFGMSWLAYSFWHAHRNNKPFQIAKSEDAWMYATKDKDSWGYCEDSDITCYMLPISPCPRDSFNPEERQELKPRRLWKFTWLRQYMFRPKQVFRQKAFELRQALEMKYPCTAIHVRRGDVAFPKKPYRRYAGLDEYIHAAKVQPGDSILLLTDDNNAIEETKQAEDGSDLQQSCIRRAPFMRAFVEDVKSQGRQVELFYVNTAADEEEALEFYGKPFKRAASLLEAISSKANSKGKEKDKIPNGSTDGTAVATEPPAVQETEGPLTCSDENDFECCADWDTNVDDWWLHKPTWEATRETPTKQCFSPMMNSEKAAFFQSLYDIQWKGNCSQLITSTQINSGYSASINWLGYTFLNSSIEQKPFQITQHDFPWMYGPKNKSHWAYCESEDITCLILPVSKCERDYVPQKQLRRHLIGRVWKQPRNNPSARLDFEWRKDFLLRPNQIMRKKVYEMTTSIDLKTPCLTMHVRRGDSGIPEKPYRRYAAVQEYLDEADAKDGDNILLLTDDQTTIDEIKQYHSNYNWFYLNRTRHSGTEGGWQSHVPSGDGPFEVAAIKTEAHLAGFCKKFVHGTSGFMRTIRGMMEAEGKFVDTYFVRTGVGKEHAKKWPYDGKERVAYFMKEMDEYRKKSNAKKKAKALDSATDALPAEKLALSPENKDGKDLSQTIPGVALDTTDGPMSCHATSAGGRECCADWDTDVDDWAVHKPTWEISTETLTQQCFAPMKNGTKAAFFQSLYDIQWKGDCSQVITSTQINSGYSASTNWLGYTFLHSSLAKKPFQITQHNFPWLYGPQDKFHWAYCDSEDITCLILPISKCERDFVPKRNLPSHVKGRVYAEPKRDDKSRTEFQWLKEFMLRPTQIFRRKLLEMKLSVNLQLPCTTMHVRRGDAGFPRQPYRRYASVQEYLDVAHVEEGDNVLLLTDDHTTIDEIKQYHTNYHWFYLNRTRYSGVDGGWESHIPSGDGPFEVLAIQVETHLAGMCEKVVHGQSGFMKVVRGIMGAEGKNYTAYFVDTKVPKKEAEKWTWDGKDRVVYFMKEMDEYRRKSLAAKAKKGNK